MTRIAKTYAFMDSKSLPHLTRLSNEDGYVLPNGSEIVFKFRGIPERPKNRIPVHIYVNDEQCKSNRQRRRIVVRIRNSDDCPNDAKYLVCGEYPEGEVLVKREIFINLV